MKNQIAPWGDPLMLENPGDELYFGEVYRTVLQEAWLPEGAEVWSRLGKSRRGRRPTQQGTTVGSPTQSQVDIRLGFQACAGAWRDLPWDWPEDPSCDSRWPKSYWLSLKQEQGIPCSYYDLFMRHCMLYYNDKGCLPIDAYKLNPIPPHLTDVECNTWYDTAFPNKCHDVSFISGPGDFDGARWKSPSCGSENDLHFKDENGALGCIRYTFSQLHRCTEFIWHPDNPDEIDPNTTLPISVQGGVPPFSWIITGTGLTLTHSQTEDRSNTLIASPAACGPAQISVTDFCQNETSGVVFCTNGVWRFIKFICTSPGPEQNYCDVIVDIHKYRVSWYHCKVDCDWSGQCHGEYMAFSPKCLSAYPACYWDEDWQAWKRPYCIKNIYEYIYECP